VYIAALIKTVANIQ